VPPVNAHKLGAVVGSQQQSPDRSKSAAAQIEIYEPPTDTEVNGEAAEVEVGGSGRGTSAACAGER
jgi:hypothetical protein